MKEKRRVVVLGAGFGGMTATLELRRRIHEDQNVEVVLVDRQPYHLFTPLLYQVATGEVEPGHIAVPVRWFLRRQRFRFIESEIRAIDLANRRVLLADDEVEYDYLVIALGSTTNFFGVPKAETYALPLKTLREAMAIKYRIIEAYRRADLEPNEEARRRLLSMAVIGGGATGVELVDSLYDLAHLILARDFPRLNPAEVSLFLAEASKGLLGGMDAGMSNIALRHLQKKGITIHLGMPIVGIEEGGLRNSSGQFLQSHTTIWATGVRPSPLLEPLLTDKSKDGRAIVTNTMGLPQWANVYAVGDAAFFVEPGRERPLAPKAAVASQEGKAVAINIARALSGQPPIPFRYKYEGDLVALGRNASVAKLAGRTFDGFPAWLLWRMVHLWKVPGVRNQVSIALDWTFDYLLRRDTMRLE